ncbi:MAG: chorismate synthase [Clostridiales bacterium]|nr:chorismate synthase [Clostridiales bacterium]
MNTQKNDGCNRQPDCVTEIRQGNSLLLVSGYFKPDAKATAADKLVHVMELESVTQETVI